MGLFTAVVCLLLLWEFRSRLARERRDRREREVRDRIDVMRNNATRAAVQDTIAALQRVQIALLKLQRQHLEQHLEQRRADDQPTMGLHLGLHLPDADFDHDAFARRVMDAIKREPRPSRSRASLRAEGQTTNLTLDELINPPNPDTSAAG